MLVYPSGMDIMIEARSLNLDTFRAISGRRPVKKKLVGCDPFDTS